MADTNRKPASTQLRETAVQKETELLAKNSFQENSNEYEATKVPVEINGALEERTKLTVMNMFADGSEYRNPDGETA